MKKSKLAAEEDNQVKFFNLSSNNGDWILNSIVSPF